MMWKKTNVIDCYGKNVFVDKYGFCNLRSIEIIAKNRNTSISNFQNYYMSDDASGLYYRIESKSLDFKQLLTLVLSKEIYQYNGNQNNGYWGYHLPNNVQKENVQKITYGTIELRFMVDAYLFDTNNGFGSCTHHQEIVRINKESDIDKIEVWYQDNVTASSFKHVVLADIKVNDELFLVSRGKVKVTKVYTFPNENGLVCDVVDLNGQTQRINYTNNQLFYLPYSKIEDEFAPLNNSKNELALSPYVVTSNTGLCNIHWQPISEAARYTVTAFRVVNRPGRRRVYHMRDYEVERNAHFIAIPDLIGDGIVFKVKAEDRLGKVIAESRCLSFGFETRDMK